MVVFVGDGRRDARRGPTALGSEHHHCRVYGHLLHPRCRRRGALRADLRRVAWYGPLTALSASVPRLVAGYDHWLVLALVCAIIFVAGLLPALGATTRRLVLVWGLSRCWRSRSSRPPGHGRRSWPRPSSASRSCRAGVPGDQRDGPDADAPDFQPLADWVATSSTSLLRTYTTPTRPQP